jgi:hypothetical protein
MVSDFGSSTELLTSKQLDHFARSRAAFESWSADHTPAEVQQAIIEISAYVAKGEAAIDETIRMNRNEYIAKAALQKRGDEIGLQFFRRHPELAQTETNIKLLIERFNLILRANGVPNDPGEVYDHMTVENFEDAYRQLAQEGRIDWDQSKGSPFGHVEWKSDRQAASNADTEEQMYSMDLDKLRDAANQQLAEHGGPEGSDIPAEIAEARRRQYQADPGNLSIGSHIPHQTEMETVEESPNADFFTTAIPTKAVPKKMPRIW